MKVIKVGIWGASGFQGVELTKLFSRRPEIEIAYIKTSEKAKGTIEDVEVAFLALSPEQSMEVAPKLLKREIKVIDLSGAFRIKNVSDFAKYYKLNHTHLDLLDIAVYGLPEKNREKIRNARLIAVPGCYATAINFGLWPLVNNDLISHSDKILIKAVSGYTGAGKQAKIPKIITSYDSDRQHKHIPEIEQELDIRGQLQFFPQIAPWPRGIEVAIYIEASIATDILNLYEEFYKQELFVRVRPEKTEVSDVIETNFCYIYPKILHSFVIIKITIDNLGKGGAGQAVQNFNILCGLPETLVY